MSLTPTLREKIGQMLLIGFRGCEIEGGEPVARDLAERNLGGVILFDQEMSDTTMRYRNIKSPVQLHDLTAALKKLASTPLLIAIDQEGGRVNRLKADYGFPESVSHEELGRANDPSATFAEAEKTARTLASAGINLNLAPVVDLDAGDTNPIIKGKKRSFSADPEIVARHAAEFCRAHHQHGVMTCAKHFPGHGSARGDTHLGLVNVTPYWTEKELLPFQRLIEAGECDTIMTAHVFNECLDPDRPATLSNKVLQGILRKRLGFDGVVLSDDMEMRAISSQYGIIQAMQYGIEAGLDVLCFGNNMTFNANIGEEAFNIIVRLVESGKISEARIDESYQRIQKLKRRRLQADMGTAPQTAATEKSETTRQRNPWLWVPSLYFSQGIPYVIVMTMSVIMYKRLGVSNTDIALYTSWLYLPWAIKPLWSPLVDITRTKRFWVVSMQFLVSIGLALVAFSIPAGGFFKLSLCLFWVMALGSATHDIAADGFYMLSMSKHEQAWWVGLRSTFYRTAMIVGSGLLVVLAGVLESRNGLPPLSIPVRASVDSNGFSPIDPAGIKVAAEGGPIQMKAWPASLDIGMINASPAQAKAVVAQAKEWNQAHGFLPEIAAAPPENVFFSWVASLFRPLGDFLSAHFPKGGTTAPARAGNTATIYLTLTGPPDAGRNITVDLDRRKSGIEYLGLAKGDKGFRLVEGERLVFNSTNWNQPAAAVIQLDPKLSKPAEVEFIASSGNIPLAWSITLFAVAGLFLCFSVWHTCVLPRPANDGPVVGNRGLTAEFFVTFRAFFQKPGALMALAFILLYRFDEAQLGKVISPFLLDARESGGLGLTTSQVGLAYGTFGIAALTCGGLLGGFAAAKYGLKKMLPIMVCVMYLPKLVFVFLSFTQPENFLAICGTVAVEQFGYGFGFTAFMLYLLYFADGPHKTAHYAICTGFMAMGMMIPGMWSGWVADHVGYRHFFVWVICSAVPGFIIAMRLKVDPQFGKKQA